MHIHLISLFYDSNMACIKSVFTFPCLTWFLSLSCDVQDMNNIYLN